MSSASKSRRGGRRPGAGRPKGTGPYGEPTRPVRIPESLLPQIEGMLAGRAAAGPGAGEAPAAPPRNGRAEVTYFMPRDAEIMLPNDKAGDLRLPLFGTRVAAGFPSPADDHLENTLDLNEHLVRRPAATFFVRVQGESMTGAGINPGDILVVDRAEEARDGKIVIAALDGELTVKRLSRRDGRVMLMPENPAFEPIPVNEEMSFVIWGVVRSVIHEF